MILAILVLIGLVLLLFSFLLFKKQSIFLALLADDSLVNKQFLQTYSIIFLGLGLIAFFLIPFATKEMTLYFLALMMLASATFSYQFSKKLNNPCLVIWHFI
ncbi:hypothetical protein ACFQOY_03730 [Enterococcus alcedinis]|uniref:hypothetical protein n=1 Tax=Enterococcus alcedinis TaxID=1274384 RepID=UPI003612766B